MEGQTRLNYQGKADHNRQARAGSCDSVCEIGGQCYYISTRQWSNAVLGSCVLTNTLHKVSPTL